jgi:hypothetical protein
LLIFWAWLEEIEGFIRLIRQFLERLFEIVPQKKSRNYAFLNAERLLGYPVKSLNIGTALVWTAYGRVGGNQRITFITDLVSAHGRGVFRPIT